MNSLTEIRDNGIPKFIQGSSEYNEFWSREINRIRNGIQIGSWFCHGALYLFINYLKMERGNEKHRGKHIGYPDFRDIDIEFFEAFHRAETERKGLCLVGARELGKSMWLSALLIRQTHFFPGSQAMISSFVEKDVETTYSKFLTMKNYLPPEFLITQLREKDGAIFYGTKNTKTKNDTIYSTLWRRTYSNSKADKNAAGPRPQLHIIDEVGKIPNLKDILETAQYMWMEGEYQFAVPVLAGTGGDMEGGTDQLRDIWCKPDAYNMISFEPYSNDYPNKTGMFIPATKNIYQARTKIPLYNYLNLPKPKEDSLLHTQVHATTNLELANEILDKKRAVEKTKDGLRGYYKECCMRPKVPSEVFMKNTGGVFFPELLNKRLEAIRILNIKPQKCFLIPYEEDGIKKIEFSPNDNGDIFIFEQPEKDIRNYRYVIGLDPVAQNFSTTTSSAAAFVYKRFIDDPIGETYNKVVAQYIKKDITMDDYNENLINLATYYDCKRGQVLYENNVGNLADYCKHHHLLHFLMYQPTEVIKEMIDKSTVDRTYGIHMTQEIKLKGIEYIRQYVKDYYDRIDSVELIEELILYENVPEKNFDLVMSFMIALFAARHFTLPIKKQKVDSNRFQIHSPMLNRTGRVSYALDSQNGYFNT